jgi:hypothetical protein
MRGYTTNREEAMKTSEMIQVYSPALMGMLMYFALVGICLATG